MAKSYEMDMCSGALFPKIVAFAVPLILSGILQLLFNAADIIVVGHFAGRESLAAVGSTTALINLMINVFVGLSIGANVLVAQYSGAKKLKVCRQPLHTILGQQSCELWAIPEDHSISCCLRVQSTWC